MPEDDPDLLTPARVKAAAEWLATRSEAEARDALLALESMFVGEDKIKEVQAQLDALLEDARRGLDPHYGLVDIHRANLYVAARIHALRPFLLHLHGCSGDENCTCGLRAALTLESEPRLHPPAGTPAPSSPPPATPASASDTTAAPAARPAR